MGCASLLLAAGEPGKAFVVFDLLHRHLLFLGQSLEMGENLLHFG